MAEGTPEWARRIRALRDARGLSIAQAADRMRIHADRELPEAAHLERRWKAWEAGSNKPSQDYAPLIAGALGAVTASIFPPDTHNAVPDLLAVTGMDTLEIVSRLQQSDVNDATLDGVRIMVDKLCSEYASQSPHELIIEGRQWLRRLVEMQEQRLTFRQRRETLEMAGWLALLVGCLENDLGDRRAAEATRKSALSLGQEVGSPGIIGWAYEMRAWFAITSRDYRGVVAAAQAGVDAASGHSVSVQLLAQEAKALARMGRRDEMDATLERGRVLLDSMPYPENSENHFIVDPLKFDFYAMDCYRIVGDDKVAQSLANEVIRTSTDFDGRQRAPMRVAEAQITIGVAAARAGELEQAISHGMQALSGERKSLPTLALVSGDLAQVLNSLYKGEPDVDAYTNQIRDIQKSTIRGQDS
jgi:transcriptional regulator with XRE-family HTH domain